MLSEVVPQLRNVKKHHLQIICALFALPLSSCSTLPDCDWPLDPQVVFLCLQYFLYGIFLNPLYICKVGQN